MHEECSLSFHSKSPLSSESNDAEKKLFERRERANRLHFEAGWSKNRITKELGMSKHFVIRWTRSPTQDFTTDARGWPKGRRRKWSGVTEQRIRETHKQLIDDPKEFFYGATALQHRWRQKYQDEPPPLRTIGQILKDLDLSSPRQKRRRKGAARYLCYPEKTIYGGYLGDRVMEADFIVRRYLKGNSAPLHFVGFAAKKTPRLRYFMRIPDLTADAFIDACDRFFARFEQPQALKLDNAATFIGAMSAKRVLSRAVVYFLSRGISPIFSVPRRPFTQSSIEGNNSVFARCFWNRTTFESLADVDRQLEWFNESSLRYTAYQKPERAIQSSRCGANVYFLRQVQESETSPGTGYIDVLNEEIKLPPLWINFFVLAKWNLQTEIVSVFIEQNEQLEKLTENEFTINKTTKKKLKTSGALSSCI